MNLIESIKALFQRITKNAKAKTAKVELAKDDARIAKDPPQTVQDILAQQQKGPKK